MMIIHEKDISNTRIHKSITAYSHRILILMLFLFFKIIDSSLNSIEMYSIE